MKTSLDTVKLNTSVKKHKQQAPPTKDNKNSLVFIMFFANKMLINIYVFCK